MSDSTFTNSSPTSSRLWILAILGTLAAVAITTTMDATGYAAFSALPLFAIVLVMCFFQRLSTGEMGLKSAGFRDYQIALLYPVVVMSLLAVNAWIFGAVQPQDTDWSKAALNLVAGSTIGILMVLITEELFFRGWLWAMIRRTGKGEFVTLAITTVVFMLWHISWAFLPSGFELPRNQVPTYLCNVIVIGAVWGVMRMISGSVIVASVSHAVWNALAYTFFGIGAKPGVLGIESREVFGPEVGWLGLGFNLLFLIWLIVIVRTSR